MVSYGSLIHFRISHSFHRTRLRLAAKQFRPRHPPSSIFHHPQLALGARPALSRHPDLIAFRPQSRRPFLNRAAPSSPRRDWKNRRKTSIGRPRPIAPTFSIFDSPRRRSPLRKGGAGGGGSARHGLSIGHFRTLPFSCTRVPRHHARLRLAAKRLPGPSNFLPPSFILCTTPHASGYPAIPNQPLSVLNREDLSSIAPAHRLPLTIGKTAEKSQS